MDDLVVGGNSIPASELEETFLTSGGPGGQHANRNETAVRLRFRVVGSSLPADVEAKLVSRVGETIEVVAGDSRSQFRNRALARQRLRDRIEEALIEIPERKATRPTKGSKQRRAAEKRARSKTKRLRRAPETDD